MVKRRRVSRPLPEVPTGTRPWVSAVSSIVVISASVLEGHEAHALRRDWLAFWSPADRTDPRSHSKGAVAAWLLCLVPIAVVVAVGSWAASLVIGGPSAARFALVLLALVVLVFLRDLAFALLGSSDRPGGLVSAVLGGPGEVVLLAVCIATLW